MRREQSGGWFSLTGDVGEALLEGVQGFSHDTTDWLCCRVGEVLWTIGQVTLSGLSFRIQLRRYRVMEMRCTKRSSVFRDMYTLRGNLEQSRRAIMQSGVQDRERLTLVEGRLELLRQIERFVAKGNWSQNVLAAERCSAVIRYGYEKAAVMTQYGSLPSFRKYVCYYEPRLLQKIGGQTVILLQLGRLKEACDEYIQHMCRFVTCKTEVEMTQEIVKCYCSVVEHPAPVVGTPQVLVADSVKKPKLSKVRQRYEPNDDVDEPKPAWTFKKPSAKWVIVR